MESTYAVRDEVTAKQSGLAEQLDRLDSITSRLDTQVSELERALSPVLRPLDHPGKGDAMGVVPESICDRATSVRGMVAGLSTVSDRIDSLLHRLDA